MLQSMISYDWIVECWVKHVGLFKLVILWLKYVVMNEKQVGNVLIE